MSASGELIEVRGLTAGYGGEPILVDVSFDVHAGEIFVILGGSGSGKSTLLKHMIGLLPPQAGAIRIDGDDIVGASGRARDAILRKIGVMYQSGALFGSLTVLENVSLPLVEFTELPRAAIEVAARLKLQLVGLEGAAHLLPAELSGGMVKRAAIARALALDPRIVFLDEPSAGLDPITAAEFDRLLLDLRAALGITFVMVTHELESIFAVADRVILLDKRTRSIGVEGTPQALRDECDDPWVQSFFHRKAGLEASS